MKLGRNSQPNLLNSAHRLPPLIAEPQQTYYIVDVMCWQGYILYDCAAEFRLYWLPAKMAESCMGSTATAQQQYKFMAVPTAPCTPGELCKKGCKAMPSRVPCISACTQTCWMCTQRSQVSVQVAWPPAQTQPVHIQVLCKACSSPTWPGPVLHPPRVC